MRSLPRLFGCYPGVRPVWTSSQGEVAAALPGGVLRRAPRQGRQPQQTVRVPPTRAVCMSPQMQFSAGVANSLTGMLRASSAGQGRTRMTTRQVGSACARQTPMGATCPVVIVTVTARDDGHHRRVGVGVGVAGRRRVCVLGYSPRARCGPPSPGRAGCAAARGGRARGSADGRLLRARAALTPSSVSPFRGRPRVRTGPRDRWFWHESPQTARFSRPLCRCNSTTQSGKPRKIGLRRSQVRILPRVPKQSRDQRACCATGPLATRSCRLDRALIEQRPEDLTPSRRRRTDADLAGGVSRVAASSEVQQWLLPPKWLSRRVLRVSLITVVSPFRRYLFAVL